MFKKEYLLSTIYPNINSGAVNIIRSVCYIHGSESIKLIFAVLYVSWTMGLTRYYKTEIFLHLLSSTMTAFWRICYIAQNKFNRKCMRRTYVGNFYGFFMLTASQ